MKSKILQKRKIYFILTKVTMKCFPQKEQFNDDINNEANPSNIIYDKFGDDRRYTFKTSIKDKDVIISGINNQILELQIGIWKYVSN